MSQLTLKRPKINEKEAGDVLPIFRYKNACTVDRDLHFQAFMYYVYGWHLGITGLEIVELTWFAHAEGPWSPEVSEAYKILIVEQPVEI